MGGKTRWGHLLGEVPTAPLADPSKVCHHADAVSESDSDDNDNVALDEEKHTATIIQENHLQQATERGTLRSLDSAARPLNATLEPELWKC